MSIAGEVVFGCIASIDYSASGATLLEEYYASWRIGNDARGDQFLLYFAYTCVRDLFIGGLFTLQKNNKVMVFYM
jgi:hypothetical protein